MAFNGSSERQWKPARVNTLNLKELGIHGSSTARHMYPKEAARLRARAQARAQAMTAHKNFPARALQSHPHAQRSGKSNQCNLGHSRRTSATVDGLGTRRDSTGSSGTGSRIGSRSRGRSRSADVRTTLSGMAPKQRAHLSLAQGALARVSTQSLRMLKEVPRGGPGAAAGNNQADHSQNSAAFKSTAVGLEVELMERLRAADVVWQNSVTAGGENASRVPPEMLVRAKLQPVRWALGQLSQALPGQAGVLKRLAEQCAALLEGLQHSGPPASDPHGETASSTDTVPPSAAAEIGRLRARVQELELALELERGAGSASVSANNHNARTSPQPALDTAFMAPSPISRRSACSFDADADADATSGAHEDDLVASACCTPASTVSMTSSCTSVRVAPPACIDVAARARPSAVPVLQLGATNEVQSYQDEFMRHKDEWSQSWREEDAGVLEEGRE